METEEDILNKVFNMLPSKITQEQEQRLTEIELHTEELKAMREEIYSREEQLEKLMQVQFKKAIDNPLNSFQEEY